MKRISTFIYGAVSYAIFAATGAYAIGFIGNFGVPKTLDGMARVSFTEALMINAMLLGIFAIQHSVMARPGFKRWWTKFVPEPAERSTYVLLSSAVMIVMFWMWEPMGGTVWHIEDPTGRAIMYGFYAAGWTLFFIATFQINHFDLFGLRQVWLYLRGKEYTPLPFKTPGFYGYVRHPIYVTWFMIFWMTPTMTVSHLVFSVATTAYILIATLLEERDLAAFYGKDYTNYQASVPRFIPRMEKARSEVQATPMKTTVA